jgi:MinD-like ATPase involved in chromosome partitioning or flagellar assembly
MTMIPSTKIITFYSFKGGTGRSMALANVAWILASSGRRVLAVDWDLEAPGLHRYFAPFLLDKDLTASEGVIDFVRNFEAQALARGAQKAREPTKADSVYELDSGEWYKRFADISHYAVTLEWNFGDKCGHLDFVPAGKQGPSYSERVNSFDWNNFYERLGGGAFLEATKESIRTQGDYDYVLIDSRTGVSDTAGICTVQMPDILVVFFTANNQSIEGTANVVASIRRRRSQPQKGLEPDLRILPVLTRLDLSDDERLQQRKAYARTLFDPFLDHIKAEERDKYWGRVNTLYFPVYAYEEVLATIRDDPDQRVSMLAAMEEITTYIADDEYTYKISNFPPEKRREILNAYAQTASLAESNEVSASRPTEQSDSEAVDHVVLTVGSLRSPLAWQKRLQELAQRRKANLQFLGYQFGYISVFAFLFASAGWVLIRRFRHHLTEILARYPHNRIDIVVHGAASYIVAHALQDLTESAPDRQRPSIHTLIIVSSVLSPNFRWDKLRSQGIVLRVLNECAIFDWVVVLTALFIPPTGTSGRVGFNGFFDSRFQNRFHRFGHNGYFQNDAISSEFMRKYWVPLLTTNEAPIAVDDRVTSSNPLSVLLDKPEMAPRLRFFVFAIIFVGLLISLWLPAAKPRRTMRPAPTALTLDVTSPSLYLDKRWIGTVIKSFVAENPLQRDVLLLKGEQFDADFDAFRAGLSVGPLAEDSDKQTGQSQSPSEPVKQVLGFLVRSAEDRQIFKSVPSEPGLSEGMIVFDVPELSRGERLLILLKLTHSVPHTLPKTLTLRNLSTPP